jgi:hypothetical protein
MSHEADKVKNSARRFADENAIAKQSKIAKQHQVNGYDSKIEKEPHRFHKHHAMDCGNPECYLCGNPRKTHKDKLTAQEKRLFQNLDSIRDKHSNGLKNNNSEP